MGNIIWKLPYYLAHPDKNIPIYDKEKLDNSDESNEIRTHTREISALE